MSILFTIIFLLISSSTYANCREIDLKGKFRLQLPNQTPLNISLDNPQDYRGGQRAKIYDVKGFENTDFEKRKLVIMDYSKSCYISLHRFDLNESLPFMVKKIDLNKLNFELASDLDGYQSIIGKLTKL